MADKLRVSVCRVFATLSSNVYRQPRANAKRTRTESRQIRMCTGTVKYRSVLSEREKGLMRPETVKNRAFPRFLKPKGRLLSSGRADTENATFSPFSPLGKRTRSNRIADTYISCVSVVRHGDEFSWRSRKCPSRGATLRRTAPLKKMRKKYV